MKRFDKEATRDPLILKKKEGAKPFKRFINLTCGTELWHAQEFCAGAPERRVLYAFWDAAVAEVPDRKVRLTNWSVTCSDEHIAYVHFFTPANHQRHHHHLSPAFQVTQEQANTSLESQIMFFFNIWCFF